MKFLNTFLCVSLFIQFQLFAVEDLIKWDTVVDKLSNDKGSDRLYAYLYNAQKTYVLALPVPSENSDSISLKMIQLFYPDFKPSFIIAENQLELANQIGAVFEKRYKEEEKEIHPFPIKERANSWIGQVPYKGLEDPSYKPWFLKKADQFRLNPPPSPTDPFWQGQLEKVKQAVTSVDEEKKRKILYWAGMLFPKSGNWLSIANKYMQEKNIPFEKQLEVRSKLASTFVDASIAAFDTKYAYLVRRPNQLDPDLKTVIPTPNHPSFPAAHTVYSYAAATILSYYFPEYKNEWYRWAAECSESRIWAGVHFPVDLEEGEKLGKNIAEYALQREIFINTNSLK